MDYVAVFNGLDLLGLVAVPGLCAFAAYAWRRHRVPDIPPEPPGWPLADDLAIARSVRASYDGLPYRRSRRAQP